MVYDDPAVNVTLCGHRQSDKLIRFVSSLSLPLTRKKGGVDTSYFIFNPDVCSPPSWESISSFRVLENSEEEGGAPH